MRAQIAPVTVASTPKRRPSWIAASAARSCRKSRLRRYSTLQMAAAMKPTNDVQAMGTWKKRMRLDSPMNPSASGA